MNGFAFITKVASNLSCGKQVLAAIERGKRYLKTRFQIHCSDSTTLIHSHSTSFALSDPSNNKLQVTGMKTCNDVCYDCLDLFKVIQFVVDTSKDKTTEDTIHDINAAINDICLYIKHLIRDAQQKKAKSQCFNKLNEETCFWLKDFCQKIIPVRFREGQKEYFGKKGMSMHVDVFFIKDGDAVKKQVFFTIVYRCEQGMASTLCICENVLKEFKKNNPHISKVFTKSDNAGSYHGNFIFEALYNVCKDVNLQLLRSDYNEPCRGKDQCDRESAAAKSIINSYVDDLVTAEDVFAALHYGNGMKDSKVAVVQIDADNICLSGETIKNVSTFHSIEFFEKYMQMWKYFDIGDGIKQPYTGVCFRSNLNVVLPFSATDKRLLSHKVKQKKSKLREDRTLCSLRFCQESGCSATFDDDEALETHMLSGCHISPKEVSTMDKVKTAFVSKMKSSSQLHLPTSTESIKLADINLHAACDLYPTMSFFKEMGWALPVRSNFRYSYAQSSLLYRYFIEGEETGKKMSADQVEKLLRKDLRPDQYVTKQQIKSLYSRWAKKYKEGSLKEPQEKLQTSADFEECEVDELAKYDDDGNDDDVEEYSMAVKEQVQLVVDQLAEYKNDDWVVVKYENCWYPGIVVQVSHKRLFFVSIYDKNTKLLLKLHFHMSYYTTIGFFNLPTIA